MAKGSKPFIQNQAVVQPRTMLVYRTTKDIYPPCQICNGAPPPVPVIPMGHVMTLDDVMELSGGNLLVWIGEVKSTTTTATIDGIWTVISTAGYRLMLGPDQWAKSYEKLKV